ncbi:PAS domain S-box protein [Paracoccus sediminis]|nr:PAS domain S-box protein [Paracoccus sediminis]
MQNPIQDAPGMAERTARHDWASTPLGAMKDWPQSLKTAVDVMLASGHAMQLAWGPDRTVLYNDAYAPMLGDRHPDALGAPFRKAWPDIWDRIAPLVDRVFEGETVRFEDMPLAMTRHGYPEDTWWSFSYSPVRNEAGTVAGLLNITVDATPRLRAERERDKARLLQDAMLEVLPIGLALIGTDGQVVSSNPAWDRFTPAGRIPSRDPDRGWRWRAWDGDGRRIEPCDFPGARALRGERCLPGVEFLYTDDTSAEIWTNVASVPLFDDGGQVVGAVSIIMDIDAAKRADRALRRRADHQAVLLGFSDALQRMTDPAEIRGKAARILGEQLGLARIFFFDLEWNGGNERIPVMTPDHHRDQAQTSHAVSRALADIIGARFKTFAQGTVIAVADVDADPGLTDQQRAAFRDMGVAAFVNVPLLRHGEYAAGIGAHAERPRAWDKDEIDLIRDVARRALMAIERAEAEAALNESEMRYRSLFETMGQGYDECELIRDDAGKPVDYRILDMNPAFERLVGMDAHHIRGRTARDIIPGLERWWPDEIGRIVATGQPERIEHEVAGSGRFYEVTIYPRGEDRFAALFDDVTERRRAETVLRDSEERQTFLLRLADAIRLLADPVAIQNEASRLLGEHLGADRTYYVQLDQDRQVATVEQEYLADDSPTLVGQHSFASYGAVLARMQAGRTVVVHDADADLDLCDTDRPAYRALKLAAFVNSPLVKNGVLVSAMCVVSARPRRWTPADTALVEDVAERTWAAVERARAEAALRASEERFREFGENSPNALWIVDVDTMRLQYLSSAFDRIWGESGDVVMADLSRWTDLVHPDDRAQAGRAMSGLLAGEPAIVEYRILRPDGDVRWIRDTGFPIHDRGIVKRGGGIAQDVTDLKRAEAALRKSEERLRQFGEASQDVLWLRDAKTLQWQYLTPAFEAIYGIARDDALAGNNYRSWLDLILPEDRQHASDAIRRVRGGEHVTFDYRIRRPCDHAVRWLRNTDFPIIDEEGRVVLVGGIGHDLTEMRETELRLQTLIEGIPQLVWRAIGSGDWTWASPQWTAYTGQYGPDSHGWGWLEMVHPEDRGAACEAWSHALETGGFEVEYRLCHAAGQDFRWFQTRAAPVRDESGRIIEWLGTSTDIHDLRLLQERQRVLVGELQHRTRNLMAVVRSMADRTGETSRDFGHFRDRFQDRLEALARAQGLLSRLGDTDRVTFDELIAAELAAMDGAADRVVIDGPSGIRLRSSMVQMLAMALHELATNAVKYGALGQPQARLTIRWRMGPPDDRGRPWLHIDWHESGVRMPSAHHAPRGTGQGRELIEKALPYQLGARTGYAFREDGIHCTISIPVSASNGSGKRRP